MEPFYPALPGWATAKGLRTRGEDLVLVVTDSGDDRVSLSVNDYGVMLSPAESVRAGLALIFGAIRGKWYLR
ncbi:hypothetical protein [Mycobacteroides abscessus]|uniref:hypothetical protein n=1 Tax=Mycobacteroides abscessus TaxID=36809 RepID=UPI00025860FE|nr:hypothetical protein [Mycobacteroides abscessus]EIC63630.1 hypothetical protein OUW_20641 [Mycobacteroides abscessus M93]